ncbi:MAG: type II toxin-antitoxin system VapC family toxin [Opitutales bacterium]|nr:type II toxin-antitoxin system VapC family toxin [Opitutales bacterium]
MNPVYFDTGVLLKLYTEEPESDAVRHYVVSRKQPVGVSSLHLAESVSALKLKCFRGECEESAAAAAILDIESDLRSGVLIRIPIDWDEAWIQCRTLSEGHTTVAGNRTLDTLHVACALQLGIRQFATSDKRQKKLAKRAGLKVEKITG